MRTTAERAERIDAFLRMVAEDGASRPGELPPVEFVESLQEAPKGKANEVAEAARESRGPPDFAGGPDE